MTEFEFWQMAFAEGWASNADVWDAADLGLITATQYVEITGEPFDPANRPTQLVAV